MASLRRREAIIHTFFYRLDKSVYPLLVRQGFKVSINNLDSITHEAVINDSLVVEVLGSLDRWSAINEGHHNQKRAHDRIPYKASVILSINHTIETETEVYTEKILFRAWCRNISPGGLEFASPGELEPCLVDDNASTIHLDHLIQEGSDIELGLPMADDTYKWMSGNVKRIRQVQHGIFNVGVAFQNK